MNKLMRLSLLIPFLTLVTSNVASAKAYEFLNGDGSNKSEVCIASTVSTAEWGNKAAELGLGEAELKTFTCNGFPIEDFAKQYRGQVQADEAAGPVKVFAFDTETKRTAAQLCVAGSTSNVDLFNAMKENNVAKNNVYLIRCNGMSLKRFSKKFGNKRYRV